MHTPESLIHLVSHGSLHCTQVSRVRESVRFRSTASSELSWDVMHRSSA